MNLLLTELDVGTYVDKNTKPFTILKNFITKIMIFKSNFLLIPKVHMKMDWQEWCTTHSSWMPNRNLFWRKSVIRKNSVALCRIEWNLLSRSALSRTRIKPLYTIVKFYPCLGWESTKVAPNSTWPHQSSNLYGNRQSYFIQACFLCTFHAIYFSP